jgi:hypothetical protein
LEYNLILIKLEGDFLKIGDSSEMVGLILYVFNVWPNEPCIGLAALLSRLWANRRQEKEIGWSHHFAMKTT